MGIWREVWFWVRGGIEAARIVTARQYVTGTDHNPDYEAFDLTTPAGPVLIGVYPSLDEAKKGVEQYFEEKA